MKNVFSICFSIVLIIVMSSCSTSTNNINTNNFYQIYNDQKEIIENASSIHTITDTTHKSNSFSAENIDNFTTDFMYTKASNSYNAVSTISSNDDNLPITLSLFFKSNTLYANTSTSNKKIKAQTTYEQFSNVYNDLMLIDVNPDNIKSIEITRIESDTLVELIVDGTMEESYFDKELTEIEFLTKRPRAELSPSFSDISYNITLNELSEIKNVETKYTVTALVPISSIYDMIGANERNLNDTVTLDVHLNTSIKDVNNTKVIFPDDLDSYVDK